MRMRKVIGRSATSLSLVCFCSLPVQAGELPHSIPNKDAKYSPFVDVDYPNQVFFGDTHCHTSFSTDAGMLGNKLGPDDAYLLPRVKRSFPVTVFERAYSDHLIFSWWRTMRKILA